MIKISISELKILSKEALGVSILDPEVLKYKVEWTKVIVQPNSIRQVIMLHFKIRIMINLEWMIQVVHIN